MLIHTFKQSIFFIDFTGFYTDADMLGLTDPRLCYILDGILLIYAIIITALFVKTKVSLGPNEVLCLHVCL